MQKNISIIIHYVNAFFNDPVPIMHRVGHIMHDISVIMLQNRSIMIYSKRGFFHNDNFALRCISHRRIMHGLRMRDFLNHGRRLAKSKGPDSFSILTLKPILTGSAPYIYIYACILIYLFSFTKNLRL